MRQQFQALLKLAGLQPRTLFDLRKGTPWREARGRPGLTPAERARLLEAIERHPWTVQRIRLRALFGLLAHFGPWADQVLGLGWSDVDLDRGEIRFPASRFAPARAETLPAVLTKALQGWKDLSVASPFVFRSARTGKSPKHKIHDHFKRILKRAGLPLHFRLHDTRHSAATWLAEKTHDTALVREILGHSSLAYTGVYVHAVEMREKLAALPPMGNGQARPTAAVPVGACDHPAHWLFAHPRELWEAVAGFARHNPMEDEEYIRQLLYDWSEDTKRKPPLTPETRERLRLAIATYYAADDLLSISGPAREDYIRLARETTRAPADALEGTVRELAAKADDREWLQQRSEAAREEANTYRNADWWMAAATLESWPRLDVLRPAGA